MASPLRPLLPRRETDGRVPEPGPSRTPRVPRRNKTIIACYACRKRKAKCDGKRPACLGCTHRNLACVYPIPKEPESAEMGAARKAGVEARSIVEQLRSAPIDEALQLLEKLRGGRGSTSSTGTQSSPSSSAVHSSPGIPSPMPVHNYVRSILPPTRNNLEFELVVRHPIAYPTLLPIPIETLTIDTLLKPSPLRRPQVASAPSPAPHRDLPSTLSGTGGHLLTGPAVPVGAAVIKELVDERLQNVDMTYWTRVHISSDLAARVISLYLEIDYPVLPLFNAELFVQDFVSGRPNFCSRFLVSALLSWACQAFAAVGPETSTLSMAFFSEAEALLAQKTPLNTLTAVSAFQLLSMVAVTHGRDDIALEYLREGVRLGRLMGLFGVQSNAASANAWADGHHDWNIATSYTAWGVFNWVCVHSLHYQRAEIDVPPILPMPGEVDTGVGISNVGDTTNYLDTRTFKACCQLWSIFNHVLWAYYGEKTIGAPSQRASLSFAEEIYGQLLFWADCLPLELVRCQESTHAVFLMHVYFHAVVTDIFRPFLTDRDASLYLYSFSTPQATPAAVYAASVNQLKRLLLLYRLNFNVAMLSVLWQTSVVYVTNAMIREAGTESTEWRFYLQLCMAGLQDLYSSFRVFGSIAKALLGMALESGAMKPREAKRVEAALEQRSRQYSAVGRLGEGKEVANWIINLDLALTDPEAAQGSSLAARFQELILEDDDNDDAEEGGSASSP